MSEAMNGPDVNDEAQESIVVPHTALPDDTLRSVIESFVLREGTDYGSVEFSLEQKVTHVMGQLERGEARILFDLKTATVTIVTAGRHSAS